MWVVLCVTVKARRTEHEKTRANIEAIRSRLEKLGGEYLRFKGRITQRRAAITTEVTRLRHQVRDFIPQLFLLFCDFLQQIGVRFC